MKLFNLFKKYEPETTNPEELERMHNKFLGDLGEKAAVKFLWDNGLRILEKNYRNEFGEIDIIAEEDETVIFLEVKTRTSDSYGSPEEAVDSFKQKHILQSARLYLKTQDVNDRDIRFDVVSIIHNEETKKNEINWIRDAFTG